jgi:hypothetical protein
MDEKTHWGGIGGDNGWAISPTDFLPFSPKLSRSTALNLGEMSTQLRVALPRANADKGRGTNRRPLGLPFASDLLRLLSLHGVFLFPLGQVGLILRLPLIVGIARNRLRRRVRNGLGFGGGRGGVDCGVRSGGNGLGGGFCLLGTSGRDRVYAGERVFESGLFRTINARLKSRGWVKRGERVLLGGSLHGRRPEAACLWSWWTEAEPRGAHNDGFGRQPF